METAHAPVRIDGFPPIRIGQLAVRWSPLAERLALQPLRLRLRAGALIATQMASALMNFIASSLPDGFSSRVAFTDALQVTLTVCAAVCSRRRPPGAQSARPSV